MSTAIVTTDSTLPALRAQEVLEMMKAAKRNLVDNFFTLGELLSEARTNNYHLAYGHARFGDWVEAQDWLDMKERQAYYLIKIVDTARELGISHDELRNTKVSKLKEIFSLDADEQAEDIKQLVADSEHMSLQQVSDKVAELKVRAGEEPVTYLNLKLPRSAKDIVLQAFDKARELYGNTLHESGELVDISDSKALEMICAEFLAMPDEEPPALPVEGRYE